MKSTPKWVGILNIGSDSFSDGGKYTKPGDALAQARALLESGANWVDVGAQSSHPLAEVKSSEAEWNLLFPILEVLHNAKIPFSIDSYKPQIIQKVLPYFPTQINDITGFENPESRELVQTGDFDLVVMFNRHRGYQAQNTDLKADFVWTEIFQFFDRRISELIQGGINVDRLVLDPGMGFFLGSGPEPSLKVLKYLDQLKSFGLRIYLSTSRKSFIGNALDIQDPIQREFGTLVTELWACMKGVDFIRTHQVKKIREGWQIWQLIHNA